MLMVYHSNRLDVLEEIIQYIIMHDRLEDPFEPEILVVQSAGMARWLQMSLSHRFNIAANIKFPLPASFIWEMFVQILPGIPKKTAFSKQHMTWKLMTILPDIVQHKSCTMLRYYLNDKTDKRKIFQLSSQIADLYDQYLVYRPDWLIKWESGSLIEGLPETQIWQAFLWKSLVELTKKLHQPTWHRANLYDRFIKTLENTDKPPSRLPSRIFVCGISALPPVYLYALKALGKHIDIHILFTNPCRQYWGDLQDVRSVSRLVIQKGQCFFEDRSVPLFKDGKLSDKLFDINEIQILSNPLLSSWGKLGGDYIHMLSDIFSSEAVDIDAFSEIIPDSLLHNVQVDILNLENRAVTGITAEEFSRSDMKRRLNPKDRSLTVHVCHSLQREVEVLHDQLLDILQDDPSITPRDIVVMASDIDKYSPFIQSVFGSAKRERHIPYTLSDRRARQFHPMIQAFINLLSLPDSRFTSEDVLALLDVRVLASRFNIDEEGLRYLRKWITDSGIRWGLDDGNVQEFDLPKTGQNTWKFGLTRMLLGYAMESSEGEWKGVLPYDESSGLIAELVGHLSTLLIQLTHWRYKIQEARTLSAWLPLCRNILNDFFLLGNEEEKILALIEQHWKNIISDGIESNYIETIPFSLLRDELIRRLDQERMSQLFLAGPVNICTLMPMRSIPFKVVCLIGMNDGLYPRSILPFSFDLMKYHPIRGDRSRRDDDRYMFLEALISAQKTLYISYIGHSIQDNSKLFPSVLLQELLDYIGQSHYLPGDEVSNCDESERHVKNHITFHHSRMPFDPINYKYNDQQSYVYEWLPAAKKKGKEQPKFFQILDPLPIQTLTLKQLQDFYLHPVRSFFQKRLQINFSSEENDISYTEPFILGDLSRYQLNQQLLNMLIENTDVETLFRQYRLSGKLPYGAFGKIIWDAQCQEMKTLSERVIKFRQSGKNIEIDLNCNGIQLMGWLKHVQPNGLLRWRPSILNVSHGLQLWLEHLVYSASGNKGESRLLVRKDGEWRFPPMDTKTAQEYLNLFIKGYLEGMTKPLLLLPESGGAWIKSCYDIKNDIILTDDISLQKANRKLLQVYEGNMVIRGEGKDFWYHRCLLRAVGNEYFNSIREEAQRYLLHLFKFNKI